MVSFSSSDFVLETSSFETQICLPSLAPRWGFFRGVRGTIKPFPSEKCLPTRLLRNIYSNHYNYNDTTEAERPGAGPMIKCADHLFPLSFLSPYLTPLSFLNSFQVVPFLSFLFSVFHFMLWVREKSLWKRKRCGKQPEALGPVDLRSLNSLFVYSLKSLFASTKTKQKNNNIEMNEMKENIIWLQLRPSNFGFNTTPTS